MSEPKYLNPPASGRGFSMPGAGERGAAQPAAINFAASGGDDLEGAVARSKVRQGGNRYKGLARGDMRRGKMNGTERQYAALLEQQRLAGEIKFWDYERQRMILTHPTEGTGASYTPDFLVILADGTLCFDDVKGSGPDNDASLVRAKAAAEICWYYRFRLVKKQTKAAGGGWKITEL